MRLTLALCAAASVLGAAPARAAPVFADTALTPDARVEATLKAMTLDEKIGLLHVPFAIALPGGKPPSGAVGSAGFVPGLARLGIPALQESDASLGVANPLDTRPGDYATPLPSGLLLGATFDPAIAEAGGAMIALEARAKGLNVLLAGGANLARDPRNGRNFEYLGEDPLLTGTLAGASIHGVQSQGVMSTVKHFAVNDQETGRMVANSVIGEAAARESDLLAFELAIERGHPGAVMCAYNKVNGTYACENPHLLNEVLKRDWRYPGFVMSDWGAVHSTGAMLAGLDQQSGEQLDKSVFFDAPLKAQAERDPAYQARVDDAVRRILGAMASVGLSASPTHAAINEAEDAKVAQAEAEAGIVLLKNSGLLPLAAASAPRILVIGGHADYGVISGGGSSQVTPKGGGLKISLGGDGFIDQLLRNQIYDPSAPLTAIRRAMPKAKVEFYDGRYPSEAALRARSANIVIVFAVQWMGEGEDAPDLTLPGGQDSLIEAVAAANPKTVVVLETGGPVLMPWLGKSAAVVEAWYPGARGGPAIANVLTGAVDPAGRLPMTFPASIDQTPRPVLPGLGLPKDRPFDVNYTEGSDVGYRWYARTGARPLFPFGFGLSYTHFAYSDLEVSGGKTLSASFVVTNTSQIAGTDTPQLYLTSAAGKVKQRLIGFARVALKPGESRTVTLSVDPRLLADFDTGRHGWSLKPGRYRAALGASAGDLMLSGEASVAGALLAP